MLSTLVLTRKKNNPLTVKINIFLMVVGSSCRTCLSAVRLYAGNKGNFEFIAENTKET